MNDISKPDLREDPKDMAPDVLRDMAKWIKANSVEFTGGVLGQWYCRECDGQSGKSKNDVVHAPECEVQVLLDLATAAGASK